MRRVLGGLALVLLAWLALGTSASAQDDEQSVRGFVRNEIERDGDTVREPVPGVSITILEGSADTIGAELGTVTTDDKGAFELGLGAPGDYTARLDESTLPDDVSLRDDAQQEVTFNVRPSETQVLNYFLGEDLRKTEGRWSILPQTIANGIKFGLIIAITAVGLSLIYGTTGLSNFAHGELVTLGAIVAWYANQEWFGGVHILLAALFGIAAGALAGFGMEKGVFGPLRHRGIGLTSMMIVSIGIAIAARYVYQFIFGGRSQAYRQYAVQQAMDLGPIDLTQRDLVIMAICLLTLLGVALYLQKARFGKAIRAVSDNPDLASATGIDVDKVILVVWVAAAGLAAVGGILLGLDEQVRWDSGFSLLLLMFAAITVGGLGNPYGALVGALVVGLFTELWTWLFPSATELKSLGGLLGLIIILLVRPQGLLGKKERVG